MSIKICLQNLGAYNNGALFFEWVDLPIDNDELDKVLDRIKVCNGEHKYFDGVGNPYEEYFIADYEADFEIGEYESIERLNRLAEIESGLSEYELEVFNYMLDNRYSDEDIERTMKNGDFHYIEASTDTELGENYINEVYGGVEHLSKEQLMRYFNFEAFGRDLAYEYTKTDNGYVYID